MKKMIQGLTLTSFVVLMSTFVLYRGGYFQTYLTSPNGGTSPQKEKTAQDTTKKKKRIMVSTKSGKVVEIDEPDPKSDTTKPKRPRIMVGSKSGDIFTPPADTVRKKPRIMSGSKSAHVFEPIPQDTTKRKKRIKPKK